MSNRDPDIISKLDTLIGMMADQSKLLAQQGERIARIEGQLVGSPAAGEFHELRGRVEEISRRLPTAIAYQPPVRA